MITENQFHPFQLLINGFGIALLAITWLSGDGGILLLLVLTAWIAASEYAFGFLAGPRPSPYQWFCLSPIMLVNYSSVSDFRIRLVCFVILAYILVLARRPAASRIKISLTAWQPRHIWLLSLFLFTLAAAAFYAQGIHLSGDEPHYILVTQSLVEDGDFDLKNNLDPKKYSQYMPVEIPFHGSVHAGRYRTFHLPGVSFLLIPFWFIFKFLGGAVPGNLYFRLAAAFINSFFALGLFLVLQKVITKKENGSLFLFFLITFPLLFQALHLFPELPAATLVVFAYFFAREKQRYFSAGLLLAGVPWLHLKYSLPILILSLFIMAWIWLGDRRTGVRLKRLAAFMVTPVLSLALLLLYSRILYGSFSPTAIEAQFSGKSFFTVPIGLRIETLISFFLDQRDGLLLYAPVFLLIFLIGRKELRSGIRDFSLLTAMFISYVLLHAFTTSRGGYSPAARPTLFVMWIMAVFLVAYYHRAGEAGKTAFRFLAGLTFFATVWFFYYPLFLYQPVTREVSQRASSMLLFLSSLVIDLPKLFPSFLKKSNAGYLPNLIWLSALALVIVLYYARLSWRPLAKPAQLIFPALGLLLMFSVCFFPHVRLQTRHTSAGLLFYCNSRNFSYEKSTDRFSVLAGQDYDLFIDLNGSAADSLNLSLLSNEKITLKVKNGRRTLLAENQAPRSLLTMRLQSLKKLSLGKKELIHLGIESTTRQRNTFFKLKFN